MSASTNTEGRLLHDRVWNGLASGIVDRQNVLLVKEVITAGISFEALAQTLVCSQLADLIHNLKLVLNNVIYDKITFDRVNVLNEGLERNGFKF